MRSELAWGDESSVARRGCRRQGTGEHKGGTEGEVDSEDAPWKGCVWPAEKPAPDWTPLCQGPGPSVPASSVASVPTLAG